ncbi:glycoside hydrolase superfamily [Massariosphaeria phaeospora]|uniref:glucan endo-1,3-beta-D-glucosidase n=1 Tax=Massariosphaeria phaeospora TaxID=100035 RepID=A0A7C8IN90_9PLEO|nr:glycoside hydrolase superfamily [Massariosphaeria phaeospora]
MRFTSSLLAVAATLSTAQAAHKGMNYGAFFLNQEPKHRADFEYEFAAAKQLPNTSGQINSARLYTMIQWRTTNTIIEAIQAAINTKTTLLLGVWASAGQATMDNEIKALKAAIQQYGKAFTDLVVGISVGSEDLYRISPTGIENKSGVGANPNELVKYIGQVRQAIKGTGLAGKPIGHVDTWTAYVNASNNAVIDALDFIGVDAYPYFQTTMANSIGNANKTFYAAFDATVAVAKGKPVWVTETGWPVSGPQQNQAVASSQNARIYWQDVSCSLMRRNVHLYYYTLQDAQYGNPSPSFGIKGPGDLMQVKPLFDLSCPGGINPVSLLYSFFLTCLLSPYFFSLLYNASLVSSSLSLVSSFLSSLVPTRTLCPICTCIPSPGPAAHLSIWAGRPLDWYARANRYVKYDMASSSGITETATSTGLLSESNEI